MPIMEFDTGSTINLAAAKTPNGRGIQNNAPSILSNRVITLSPNIVESLAISVHLYADIRERQTANKSAAYAPVLYDLLLSAK